MSCAHGLPVRTAYCTGIRANRDKREALIREMGEYLRRSNLYNRLRRLDALEKASEEIEKVHDLGSPATRQRLEDIFYLLRLARQVEDEG